MRDMQLKLCKFLSYYERAHQNVANRYVHHITHALAALGILFLTRPLLGIPLIATGFLLSWTGHDVLERNTPAFVDPVAQSRFSVAFAKKAQIALGGLVWSGACLLRLFHIVPLIQPGEKFS